MNLKLIIAIALGFGLAACEQFTTPTQPQVVQTGTGDSGGGNSYKGKPLDSYVTNPKTLPAFKNVLEAKLALLGPDRADFARLFNSILTRKVWYLIPGSLESLPAKQIGSAVPTDQVALQDFKSVWVNQEIFDAMSEKDQANLLLHEILMGVKLLRFESEQNQCFSTSVEKLKCLQLYKPGASVALTDQDYHEIRRTVAEIMGYTEIVPGVEVEDLFAKNEFSFPLREYFLKEDILTNSTYKLFEQLQSSYFSDEYFASTYVGDDQQVPAYTGPCGSGRPELRDNVLYIYLMPMLKVKDSYVASMSLMKLVYNQTNQNGDDSLRTITMWGTWQHTNSSGEWVDSQVEAQFVMLNQRFRSLIISVDGQRISCEYGK